MDNEMEKMFAVLSEIATGVKLLAEEMATQRNTLNDFISRADASFDQISLALGNIEKQLGKNEKEIRLLEVVSHKTASDVATLKLAE